MAENESLIAAPQNPEVAASALPLPDDADVQVPSQAVAPAIEQSETSIPAEPVKQPGREGDVKPLGLVTPVH